MWLCGSTRPLTCTDVVEPAGGGVWQGWVHPQGPPGAGEPVSQGLQHVMHTHGHTGSSQQQLGLHAPVVYMQMQQHLKTSQTSQRTVEIPHS